MSDEEFNPLGQVGEALTGVGGMLMESAQNFGNKLFEIVAGIGKGAANLIDAGAAKIGGGGNTTSTSIVAAAAIAPAVPVKAPEIAPAKTEMPEKVKNLVQAEHQEKPLTHISEIEHVNDGQSAQLASSTVAAGKAAAPDRSAQPASRSLPS